MQSKTIRFVSYTFVSSWFFWMILKILADIYKLSFSNPVYLLFFILGGLAPFYIVFFIYSPKKDKKGFEIIKKRTLKWRVNVTWYLWIVIIPVIIFLIPWFLNKYFMNINPKLFIQQIYYVIPLFLINIIMGGLEEVGWRGVLLTDLLKKYSKFNATIFTSLIWSLWHLPLWFIYNSPQKEMNILLFIILGLVFSFQLSIVYIKTESILLCILLHSIFNTYPNIINIGVKNILTASIFMLSFSIILFLLVFKDELYDHQRRSKNIWD